MDTEDVPDKFLKDNPACPYCGVELDNESEYAVAEDRRVKYACNSDGCAATAWTPRGWEKEQEFSNMLAQYI